MVVSGMFDLVFQYWAKGLAGKNVSEMPILCPLNIKP